MFLASGIFQIDPLIGTKHFEKNWELLLTDQSILDYYAWLLLKQGIPVDGTKSLWGPHISVLKGEFVEEYIWYSLKSKLNGIEVDFYYNHVIRFDNGRHAWVDVYSEDLGKIRQMFGFEYKPWYHMTIGRLKNERFNN